MLITCTLIYSITIILGVGIHERCRKNEASKTDGDTFCKLIIKRLLCLELRAELRHGFVRKLFRGQVAIPLSARWKFSVFRNALGHQKMPMFELEVTA